MALVLLLYLYRLFYIIKFIQIHQIKKTIKPSKYIKNTDYILFILSYILII